MWEPKDIRGDCQSCGMLLLHFSAQFRVLIRTRCATLLWFRCSFEWNVFSLFHLNFNLKAPKDMPRTVDSISIPLFYVRRPANGILSPHFFNLIDFFFFGLDAFFHFHFHSCHEFFLLTFSALLLMEKLIIIKSLLRFHFWTRSLWACVCVCAWCVSAYF